MCRTSKLSAEFSAHRREATFMTRIINQPRPCLSIISLITFTIGFAFLFSASPHAQRLPRDQWGAVPVSVSHTNGKWIIAGAKNKVTVDDAALTIRIQAGTT